MQLKNDRGDRMRISPDGLICVVPPTMLFTALQALDVALVGGGTDPIRQNILQAPVRGVLNTIEFTRGDVVVPLASPLILSLIAPFP